MASMSRFVDATGVDAASIANCYAMAENVFAVTHSAGLSARTFAEADAVSCGPPIPGVDLKIVGGEVHVRSPYSLSRYEGGQRIADPEGFYPTGDVGEIVDGELYILGRTRDVMISRAARSSSATWTTKSEGWFREAPAGSRRCRCPTSSSAPTSRSA